MIKQKKKRRCFRQHVVPERREGFPAETIGVLIAVGRGLSNALAYAGRTESTVLLEEPEPRDAELLRAKEAEANAEAEKSRPGLTIFTDGSRLDGGATGYAVVCKNGKS